MFPEYFLAKIQVIKAGSLTSQVFFPGEVRPQILRFLSGHCFEEKTAQWPAIAILSPFIGDILFEIDEQVYEMDELFYGLDYGIKSINLPYALLLLKLYGTDVTLITLPPTEANYGKKAPFRRHLLDFLDEIGCNIYVNPNLNSKLILANDLALIDPVDLSKPDLCNPEEIGVIMDDGANLRMLMQYVRGVISESPPHGLYSACKEVASYSRLCLKDYTRMAVRGTSKAMLH